MIKNYLLFILLPDILTALRNLMLQFGRLCHDELLEIGMLQRSPYLLVRVPSKRVQIEAQCAGEEHRLLGNDSETGAQVMQSQLADVHPVDDDFAAARFDHTEEGQRDGTFA